MREIRKRGNRYDNRTDFDKDKRIENHKEINKEINRLISTKGYEKTLQLLKELS